MLSILISLLPALASPDPAAELAAGMAAQRAGETATAKAAYQRCLQVDPEHVGCLWELGWSHWSAGEWAEVVARWEQVAELEPAHSEVGEWLPRARGHLSTQQRIEQSAARAPATTRAPLPEGSSLRLRAVGDIMMGTDFPHPTSFLPPEDGATLLDGVRELLVDAELSFGNLEGPLCDSGQTSKCSEGENCYAFRTPSRYGRYLQEAGFDVLSTANNHAGDFGETCRIETEQHLDALGIAHTGRPGTTATLALDSGIKVGVVGFHSSPSCNYLNDHGTAAGLVRSLAATHDLVIVSFHGGAEGSGALNVPDEMETFYGEQRGHLRAFARAVVGAGADVVLGHGPHVPRGLELIDGHLVAYSLGNFATYGRFSLSGHLSTSLVLEAVLGPDGQLVHGRILPVRLEGQGVPMPDPSGRAIDLIRTLSAEDFPDSSLVIAQDGTFAPG